MPTHGLLIDLSLDRATRCEHGIVLTPTAIDVPRNAPFFLGQSLITYLNGCLLQYQRISDTGYEESPNWHADPPVVAVTNQVIVRLRAR